MTTKSSFSLDEKEMRVEPLIETPGLVFLKLRYEVNIQAPPHLNPLPPGERKKKNKRR